MDGTAIANRVRRQFGDQFSARIKDADIIDWINAGMREIVQKNELLQVTGTSSFVFGQSEYDLPNNIMNLYTVVFKGRPLRGLGFKEFMSLTQDMEGTVTGVPTHFTLWANKLRFYPNPNLVDTFSIYYLRLPASVTALSETPELPELYHDRLLEYCLAQAAEFDENPEQYANKMAEFTSKTNDLKDNVDWEERDQYPVIMATPEEYGDGFYDMYWPG